MSLIAPSPKSYATSQGHFYFAHGTEKAGQPCYEVPCKSRPGEMRATNIKDCRSLRLAPSVTTITKLLNSPFLTEWKIEQVLNSALTLPEIPGEDLQSRSERIRVDADEQSRKAREKGTSIHGAIECALDGKPYDTSLDKYVAAGLSALSDCGLDTKSRLVEHSFASPLGYAGKTDLVIPQLAVCDYKSKQNWTDEQEKKGLGYVDNLMQLAAYARGLDIPNCRLINIFISTEVPGKYAVREWPAEDHQRHFEMFMALHRFWCLSRNYDPTKP